MNYYYLAASLPSISMDAPPALASGEFLAACREQLTAGDLAEVEALLSDPLAAQGRFSSAWQAWETQFRNTIAEVRAEREKRDAAPFLRPEAAFDAGIEHEVLNAFSHHSPLDRERALDRARWRKAEALAGFLPFSADAIKSYALRLQLAERWAALDRAAGNERVDRLVSRPAERTAEPGPQPGVAFA